MKVRLGCLSCPFPCLSVAIFTDLNCGDVLPTPCPLYSRFATIIQLLIQNQ
jgi:hypothetical protein